LADHDPSAAAALADELLRSVATEPGVPRLTAQWALGRARYEMGDLSGASATMRDAVREGGASGNPGLVAQVRMSLAATLIEAGSTGEAFAQLDAAEPHLEGGELGRLFSQRAFIYNHLGRLTDAIEAAARGLVLLRDAGDRLGELRLLLTRAVSHLNAGTLAEAELDLVAAQPIAASIDHSLLRAVAEHNLGVVHARRGAIPQALRCYETASNTYASIGRPGRMGAILDIDRAETLLHAGLYDEAVEVAGRAVKQTEHAANVVNLADARLLLARSQLLAGDDKGAKESALLAQEASRAGGREAWADLAEMIALEAVIAGAPDARSRPALILRARRLARRLESEGWGDQAGYVDGLIAEWALRWGRGDLLVDELARVHAALRRGRPAARARAWYVAALAHLARGDRRSARRALLRGLNIIDEHRESLGASDLRARSAALAVDLTALGLHMAVEGGHKASAFSWAERSRAWALRGPRVRPPDDTELGRRLAEIRNIESALRNTEPGSSEYRSLRAQLFRAERGARDQARTAMGTGAYADHLIAIGDLRRLLGPRCLIEYFVNDGALLAAVVTAVSLRIVNLGALAAVQMERDYLGAELHRTRRVVATGRTPGRTPAPSARLALDNLIISPLGLPSDAEVVIVPTGSLHGVLWSALPGLRERPFTVAPSATSWARLAQVRSSEKTESLGVILGPNLPGGKREAEALRERFPWALSLEGDSATTSAAMDILRRVRVAHVAAHGSYRSDSPLFSSFRLADGSLTVYDLETLDRPPELFVVSACNAGEHSVSSGDELLGMASALLASGVRAVVAPGVAIPDLDTPELVGRFYDGISNGLSVAAALTAARTALWSSPSLGEQMAAWSFVCFGYSSTIPTLTRSHSQEGMPKLSQPPKG
jgi:tetratricopeptide (TPR) repeat protein